MGYEVKELTFFFVNAWIIKGEKTVLFDTGAVVEPDQLEGFLAENGVDPKEIDYIVISHAHWDHFGLVQKWKELSGAKVICHKNAVEFLKTGKKDFPFDFNYTPAPEQYELFKNFMMTTRMMEIPPVDPDIVIGDEGLDMHEYGIPGKLMYTPGHADSAIALVMDDRTCFTGDTIVDLHTIQCLEEFYPEGSYSLNWIRMDNDTIADSVRKLLEVADNFNGGHGVPYTRADIEKLV